MRAFGALAFVAGQLVNAEHAHLFSCTNPAALGYAELPLDLSYNNVQLEVQGSVPAYLNGTLYRGAPGAWPDGWWLSGLITINAFKFSAGKVSYTMQWNKDEVYNRTVAGTPPAPALKKAETAGAMPHPANSSWQTGVAFRQVDGCLIGSTGVSNVNQIDFETLQPIQLPFEYEDNLGAPFLAPTHDQTVDGYVLHHLTTGVQPGSGGELGYVVTSIKPGTRKRDVIAKIEKPKESSPWAGKPSFQHMPLATADYYIMLEAPCYYPESVTKVGSVDWKGWGSNPLAGTHLRLVNRSSGESLIYPLSFDLFAIHQVNAYHDAASNSLVVDTIQLFPSLLPCSIAFSQLTVDFEKTKCTMPAVAGSKLFRIRVPLGEPGKKLVPVQIGNITGVEFPTIRYDDLNGKPYKYTYASWSQHAADFDSIVKVDMDTGAYSSWYTPGHFPGEPIFVPSPDGATEDDGTIMTNVLDTTKNQTYLLLLDGKTLKEVARAGPTPHLIPHGYHGRYFDSKLNAAKVQEELALTLV